MHRLSFDSCKLYTDGTGIGCFTHYLKHVTLNENFLASLSAGPTHRNKTANLRQVHKNICNTHYKMVVQDRCKVKKGLL